MHFEGPNIHFVVSQMSRFMHSPRTNNCQVVKHVFCYLSGTRHLGFFMPRGDHRCQIYMLFWILSGLVVTTLMCPQVVFASCLATHAYRGWARSSLLWPLLVVKLSTWTHLQVWLSVFVGSDTLWLIWVLPPLSSLTIGARWQLLRETQCSMLALSTLRCIIIMSRRGYLQERLVWHVCQHKITLCYEHDTSAWQKHHKTWTTVKLQW